MAKQFSFLLVDDDPDDTFLFGEVLRDVASSVVLSTAANGHEAKQSPAGSHFPGPEYATHGWRGMPVNAKEQCGVMQDTCDNLYYFFTVERY
jgi:hypothetical protein